MTAALVIPGYTVSGSIGRGGMGEVHAARHEASGRDVAIKVLHPDRTTQHDLARFEREARAMRAVRHPNLCEALDFGSLPDGTLFLVMERLIGEDVAALLRARDSLSTADALTIARDAALGLVRLHDAGLLHRDVKPSNLFLHDGPSGRVLKVLDFGLATFTMGDGGRITRTGEIVGTPAYMAPEQARGIEVDFRADIYSLGAVLYHMLTGAPPHGADNALAILMRMLSEEAPSLGDRRPDVPAPLQALVGCMLARQRELRPAGLRDVIAALELSLMPGGIDSDETLAGRPSPLGNTAPNLADEQRLVTIVVASGVTNPSAVVALLRKAGAIPLLGENQKVFGLFGATEVDGDELEKAADAARAIEPLARHVDIGAGRARGRDGHVSGNIVDLAGSMTVVGGTSMKMSPEVLGDGGLVTHPAPAGPLPFVGRDAEVAEIVGKAARAFDDEEPSGLFVLGPPGVGKTRLVGEAIDRLKAERPGLNVLSVRGETNRRYSSWHAIAHAIGEHLDVGQGRDPTLGLARIATAAAAMRLGPDAVSFLAAALALPPTGELSPAFLEALRDPKVMRDQLVGTLGDFLEALASDPMVLLIEDVQWVDGPSLEVVDAALRRSRAALFVLLTGRTQAVEQRPELFRAPALEHRPLRELGMKPSERLVEAAFSRRGVPAEPEIAKALVEHAGGNPFFIGAICDHVADAWLRSGGEALDPTAFALPLTVEGAVQSRLDHLPHLDKDLLKRASIFGMRFWEEALPTLGCVEPGPSLGRLDQSGLVVRPPRRDVRLAGLGEQLFRQRVVREVAYAMLTPAQRRGLHRLAARFFGTLPAIAAEEIAQHLTEGGDNAAAAPLWTTAARDALRNGDLPAARLRIDAALNGASTPEGRAPLLLLRMTVAFELQLPALVEETLAAFDATGVLLGDVEAAEVLYYRGRMLAIRGRYAEADATLRNAEGLRRKLGDGDGVSRVLAARALARLYGGIGDAQAFAEEAIATATAGSSVAAVAALALSHVLMKVGAFFAARDAALSASVAARESGDLHRLQSSLGDVAYVAARLGRFEEARDALETVIADSRRVGRVSTEGFAWHNLGLVRLELGDPDGAVAAETRALELGRESASVRLVRYAEIYLARIRLARGELAEALSLTEGLLAAGVAEVAPDLHTIAASIHTEAGRFEDGLVAAREARRLADTGAVLELLAERDAAEIRCLFALGRDAEGRAVRDLARVALLERAARAAPEGEHRDRFLAAGRVHRVILGEDESDSTCVPAPGIGLSRE